MALRIAPKTRYHLKRILPFGIIWLALGWFVLLIESLATDYRNYRPQTDITLSWEIFLFASLAVFALGLAMGAMEVFWLGRLFKSRGLGRKILYKMGIYLLFMLVINFITYPLAAALEAGTSPLATEVLTKFSNYLVSPTFLSTLLSLSFSIFVCLLYAGISEHLGHSVLVNFFTGRYHQPREESRIFMFVDMQASTSLAEQMGHQQYFRFLSDYYNALSDAILDQQGEVYQYVGDEIVITWKKDTGLVRRNCLHCFYEMRNALKEKADTFKNTYGVVPSFRAGMHVGTVTTGEIGALKKEIFFTGDVLNVTARIQKLCKKYERECIVSKDLLELLDPGPYKPEPLGALALEGRRKTVSLFALA